MFNLPWETEETFHTDSPDPFDRSTAEQRVKAAYVMTIGLVGMIDSLKDRSDVDATADREYAVSLASKLKSNDPSISDIWVAADLVRVHKGRQKQAIVKAQEGKR